MYSYEYLKNLREKYQILKEKLSKQKQQIHVMKVDLSEFTMKISNFEKLISQEIKVEMRDLAAKSEVESSDSSKSSMEQVQSRANQQKKQKKIEDQLSIWDKIQKRNKEAEDVDLLLIKNSKGKIQNIPASFSIIYREYHRFLEKKSKKIENIENLLKQLTVAKEKKLIFENQVKLCYKSLINNCLEYEKVGMIKIIDEMNFFGILAQNLKMPLIIDEQGIQFLKTYSNWKWFSSKIEINSDNEPSSKSFNSTLSVFPKRKTVNELIASPRKNYLDNRPSTSIQPKRNQNVGQGVIVKQYQIHLMNPSQNVRNKSATTSCYLYQCRQKQNSYMQGDSDTIKVPVIENSQNVSMLNEAFNFLLNNMQFKSYMSHNSIREKLTINMPYVLDWREAQFDMINISKLDKIFLITESMTVLKEKEILRIIGNQSMDTVRILNSYFGQVNGRKICNQFKVVNF